MQKLSAVLKFKYTWRNYQQKFLNGFQEHIKDGHLHVIAPPGSGKTILGLEILIRIGKPTLVLSPTLTIRNQWRSRLLEFFIHDTAFQNLSLDLKSPSQITLSTYQSLFALSKSFNANAQQQLLEYIKFHKIETLVLDEAHHLKNEWWHCLYHLKEIKGLTVVSLTATPPYDSSTNEINRYFSLCGPIDDEIAVPDLIKNGDLCPHQDFVYFSKPEETQIKYIVRYREQILNFTNSLLVNTGLQENLITQDFYVNPKKSLDYIYKYPTFFSAIIIYLNSCGYAVNEQNLRILGFSANDVTFPSFTYEWAEALLQHLLVDQRDTFSAFEEILMPLEKELKRIGVLANKRVNFVGDEVLYRNLSNSPGKLESIFQIVKHTEEYLGASTRTVILTDFIRKEFLNFEGFNTKTLNKLGVVPIFKYLLAKDNGIDTMGVLTGSLVILHENALPFLKQQLSIEELAVNAVAGSLGYIFIKVPNALKNKIAESITQLFEDGVIKTLIGTKAFLGEGWDAPCINTLILASYVGSFVSSNQMRGRAIRVDANTPNKTGAIWHLACLDPTAPDGGKDMEKLQQRFDAFTGVSLRDEIYISNGIDRLVLPLEWSDTTDLREINSEMLKKAQQKSEFKNRWHKAIEKGNVLVRELKIPFKNEESYAKTKQLHALNASKYVMLEVVLGVSLFVPEFLIKNMGAVLSKGMVQVIYIFCAALILGFGPKTFKALKLYFLFGNQYRKTKKIGKAILAYLLDDKTSYFESKDAIIHAEQNLKGTFSIHLKNASQHDSNLFISLLEEVIAPIDNPKYVLVNGNWIKKKMGIRNYYVVPKDIGKNKTGAHRFKRYWNTHVDGSKLLFTRTLKGRKELLKARFSHLKYQFEAVSQKTITWK
ncbi:DEAD/DEAH box helicase family protein [Maribacter ulvicola]|uniref:Helicase conserved C-terminal domain-containing protein n=1 Tax=Maribacter ulvicola TaxID=228959 RepID=A0A1N6PTN1_9FLAO|nr:DEAD/DEAH box helicase family protein [Maribacter ulvicola]SIQ07704.1 Helicase conserved C-terminal domain-containing protein [Maribacter ulvicola]